MTAALVNRTTFGQPALPWNPLPYMDEYLLNLEVDGRSKDYIKSVKQGLSYFAEFSVVDGFTHPGEVKRENILRFQAWLNGKTMAVSYRQQMLKYTRGWVNWMFNTRYLPDNPWFNIRVGRMTKKPNPLEDEEVEALFSGHRQQAFSMPPFMWHRREVILALLYGWGLRIHELHALNVSQMDMRLEWVTSINKGGGTKVLPYADVMKEVTQRWLRHRGKYAKVGQDSLLIDQEGKRLSIEMIRKIITELGDRSGVAVNPHRLRDTCGTNLLDDDVPIERVQKILGHTDVAQTRSYARVNDHKVKESHDASMNIRLNSLLFKNTGDLDD
jgi:site-specific recombinase XerD